MLHLFSRHGRCERRLLESRRRRDAKSRSLRARMLPTLLPGQPASGRQAWNVEQRHETMSLGGDVRKCGERVQRKLPLLRGVLQQRRLRSEQRTNRKAELHLAQLRIISHPFQSRLSNHFWTGWLGRTNFSYFAAKSAWPEFRPILNFIWIQRIRSINSFLNLIKYSRKINSVLSTSKLLGLFAWNCVGVYLVKLASAEL